MGWWRIRRGWYADADADGYGDPEGAIASLYAINLPPDLPETDREDILLSIRDEQEPRRAAIHRYIAAPDVDQQIEALRVAAGFEGTHSVIDIPTVEQLSPVPAIELIAHFGHDRPNLEAVRSHGHELENLVRSPGSGVWFEAQDGIGADFWVIVGISGD